MPPALSLVASNWRRKSPSISSTTLMMHPKTEERLCAKTQFAGNSQLSFSYEALHQRSMKSQKKEPLVSLQDI